MLQQSAVNLYGPDLNFNCVATSCEGSDPSTVQIFRALQAQINRFAIAGSRSSANPGLWKSLILVVTGKLDKATVNTYKLLAAGLTSMGLTPPVGERQATMQSLAERADEVARFVQDAADRAGLPAGEIQMATGGGFGPTSTPTNISPEALRRITEAANPSPLVSFMNKLPGASSTGGKVAWAVGGVLVVAGIGYLLFRTPEVD